MSTSITRKLKKVIPNLKLNIWLKNHTTFKIGGKAKYFFEAKTKEDLINAVKAAKQFNLPFYILGDGSKLLIADKGIDFFVIKVKNSKIKVAKNKIFVEAGASLKKLTEVARDANLAGLQWGGGLPGTVGGATRGNAGAFLGEMADIITKVETFDTKTAKVKIFKNKDCKFTYRNSTFKKNPNLIILSCEVKLYRGNKKQIQKEMQFYIGYRKQRHPQYPSAGSIFENPSDITKKGKTIIPAGKLIGDCGLAGKKIGSVKISEQHSNFIVNLGDGKEQDVKKLIKLAKKKVKQKFGIDLKEEVQYVED
jgi:UDP-N-acetylmuramate dehydrogenase